MVMVVIAAVAAFGSCSNPLAAAAQTARTMAVAPSLSLSVSDKTIASGGTLNVDPVFISESADTTITIKNSGTNDLDMDVSGITLTLGSGVESGTFSIENPPAATLVSGATTTLTLRFSPASIGAKSATISIPSNDALTPVFSFTATGTGFSTVLSTTAISSVTWTSASSGGDITSDGGSPITARGICWSTSPNPTVANESQVDGGAGTGSFTCTLSGLLPGTYYYVRAWATNAIGTGYAHSVGFTTTPATAPTTTAPSAINATSATAGGTTTADTGVTISARGVCWNTTGSPTVGDAHTIDGSGAGSFTSGLTGLAYATTYHVRSYATNQGNTVYGNEVTLKTVGYTDNKGFYVFYDAGSVQTDATYGDWRYMIAAPSDMGTSIWSNGIGYIALTPTGIGTGRSNTDNIVGPLGTNAVSAYACTSATFGGYSDWFLPSKDELNLMMVNLASNSLGGFNKTGYYYWTSSVAQGGTTAGSTIINDQFPSNCRQSVQLASAADGLTRAARRVITVP